MLITLLIVWLVIRLISYFGWKCLHLGSQLITVIWDFFGIVMGEYFVDFILATVFVVHIIIRIKQTQICKLLSCCKWRMRNWTVINTQEILAIAFLKHEVIWDFCTLFISSLFFLRHFFNWIKLLACLTLVTLLIRNYYGLVALKYINGKHKIGPSDQIWLHKTVIVHL